MIDTDLTFNDLGVSAYRGKNAEAGRLADFLVAVEDGIVPRGSYLLVESLDRISRQAARKALRVLEDIAPTALSGRPTTSSAGMPAAICTCTSTGTAS
jgi:hypothetical protein